ncbi:hypothetical protein ABMA28_010791 [Loxostege sticticalis]|uniref:Major facilitator superfamily (MFS) profile domain-containing protein n=1 Tax=Loxostege sticticalis TaxID=481309 RepID=A0ABD0S796_LOXSC
MTYTAVKVVIRNGGLKTSPFLRQAWTISAIFLIALSTGIMPQHSASAEDSNSEQITPLSAYNTIAIVVGCLASSILMDKVGRKLTFILGTLLGILTCCVVYLPGASMMGTLRITFSGLSTGYTVILATIVIGEYTSPKYRGVFLNLITTSMNIGNTIGLILRPNYHLELLLTALLLQILSFGIATTWPESPYWLASKKQLEKSKTAFQWLRNSTCKKELDDLRRKRTEVFPNSTSLLDLLKKYSSSEFLRPVTVVVFGVFLMVSSGRHFIALSPLQTMGVDYRTYQILTSSIISLSSIVTLSLLLIFRHRMQLLISGSLTASVLFLSSGYTFLINNKLISDISWLGSLLFILQLVLSNLGSTSIPLALIGEVFPMNYKAAGSFISGLLIAMSSWVVVRSNPYLLSVLHFEGVLVLVGTLLIISLLVLFFILPETKNKTLLEIEEYFQSERSIREEISNDKVRLTTGYYMETGSIPLY